ncbi:MAG: PDZ domain-containing protein, partial [Planctomycetes bacterium]|nr:PDZ domain-containing protein [Planctomycetota bacterium]
ASLYAQTPPKPLTADELNLASQINTVFRRAVQQVLPSVVSLRVYKKTDAPSLRFFEPDQSVSLGSGIIIDPDGYIVTNNHVAEDYVKIEVILNDGSTVEAIDAYLDPDTDLAIVHIDPSDKDLHAASFGDSDKAQVGDFVLAIGSPFSLTQTVTMGIISFKGRQTQILGKWGYEDFIQTDADINKGNSGGPLINLFGEIVGVNSNILSPTGVAAGYGFSIPSNIAKNVSEQLIANKRVERGWLGVNMIGLKDIRIVDTGEVDLALGKRGAGRALGKIPLTVDGVWISEVVGGSPAEEAGLELYDVVITLDGKEYFTSRELRDYIATLSPGHTAICDIWRDGEKMTVKVTLGDRAEARAEEEQTLLAQVEALKNETRRSLFGRRDRERSIIENPPKNEEGKLGIKIGLLTPEYALSYGYAPDVRGVFIVEVTAKSLGEQAKLKVGDIILSIDGKEVKTPKQIKDIVEKADLKKGIRIKIRNKDGEKIRIVQKDPTLK